MINRPAIEDLNRLPRLDETENIPSEDKIVHLHFTIDQCHWFAIEWDGQDTFFGYVLLNGWNHDSEFGYFTLSDLLAISLCGCIEVMNDPFWIPRATKDIGLIRECQAI